MARQSFASVAGDPFKLVALVPLGSKLRLMRVKGVEYWFARTPARPGVKSARVYVGSDANKARLEAAWATVQAEIEKAEATPEGRRLRELQELAGGPSLARTSADVVAIPILDTPQAAFQFAAGMRQRRRPKR